MSEKSQIKGWKVPALAQHMRARGIGDGVRENVRALKKLLCGVSTDRWKNGQLVLFEFPDGLRFVRKTAVDEAIQAGGVAVSVRLERADIVQFLQSIVAGKVEHTTIAVPSLPKVQRKRRRVKVDGRVRMRAAS